METGVHELTAGYALDALDADERRAYEAHLAACERCREELASFWETTAALAVGASGPTPSADLRERILSEARAEPPVVVPFERPRRRVVPALAAVAAAAAVVATAIGLWAAGVSKDLDEARSALERERAAALVLADPEARSIRLLEGDGRLVVASDGHAVLVVDGLGPAPSGKTYEAWIVAHGGSPVPAGVFPGGDGTDVVGLDGVVDAGDVVLVTVERHGGVDEPTGEPIVGSLPA